MMTGELSNGVRRFLYFVEITSWTVTCILTFASFWFIAYQLWALYVPYWKTILYTNDTHEFPDYFYRVYGDNVTTLTYEHYGYLLSACIVSIATSIYVVPNHPFAGWKSPRPKID